jgi:hypothetical protein
MLTDDEKPKLDYRHIDDKKNQVPNWLVVEDLLGFADKLKAKCDDVSDRIFLLNSLQIFSFLIFFVGFVAFTSVASAKNISTEYFLTISVGLLLTLFAFCIFVEISLIKLRRRVRSDLRALDSVINLLRDNYTPITEDFSELQKIQLKIRLSRFDIKTSIREFYISSNQ